MPKKLTREIFIEKAEKIHNWLYDYSKVNYEKSNINIKIICSIHGEFLQTPNSHLCGAGCPDCGGNKKSTNNEFKEKAEKIHGTKYDYSAVDYKSAHIKVSIICQEHGAFKQTPHVHLKGRGCSYCGDIKRSNSQKCQEEDFIIQSIKKHNNRYDYSLVEYKNSKTKIKIKCSIHGGFLQTPSKHLAGQGCPKCQGLNKTVNDIIDGFRKIHGDKYDYYLMNYINCEIKIKIICPLHGVFLQIPSSHLNGAGCPKCGIIKRTKTQLFSSKFFVQNAKIVHGDKYDYSLVDYKGAFNKIKIKCQEHGEFEQRPNDHLHGQGCPKCSPSISLPEIIWLNINKIKPEFRQYKILNYTVDGYDPNTNTVYEFHGDYWHGNPNIYKSSDINKVAHKTFGKLYENTIKREQAFTDAGYNLITIWESEFREQYKEQIKNYKSLHGAQKIIESNNY